MSGSKDAQRDPQTYAIIGAAMEVHRAFGPGFLESVYQDALEIEFIDRGIPHRREARLSIDYKGRALASHHRADFICFERVVVELKAVRTLSPADEAQLFHYLKATRLPVGLLMNFGACSLEYRRRAAV